MPQLSMILLATPPPLTFSQFSKGEEENSTVFLVHCGNQTTASKVTLLLKAEGREVDEVWLIGRKQYHGLGLN